MVLFVTGDVDMEILARVVETISDPAKMLGPQVCFVFFVFFVDYIMYLIAFDLMVFLKLSLHQ